MLKKGSKKHSYLWLVFPKIILGLCFLSFNSSVKYADAQTISAEMFPKPVSFIPPLDGALYINGTFGEPRPNHYHAGLDLKTNGQIGKKVYAADEGYISRIKVSATGYGNALYLNHPSDMTTVYAHLDRFVKPIADWIKSVQYELQSFEIDTVLPDKRFFFKQGAQIAFSGNTGGSAGPHLHFEIRDTYSEIVINPMKYLEVIDYTRPVIGQLKIYPVQESLYDHPGIRIPLTAGSSGVWGGGETEVPEGLIMFAVQAYDQQDLTPMHKNGIPTVKMFVNDELVFVREKDSIDFDETRYTHAMADYSEKFKNGTDYYLATLLPGNLERSPYLKSPSDGRIKIADGEVKKIGIHLIDFHGNTSKVTFTAKGIKSINSSETIYLNPNLSEGSKQLDGAEISWDAQTFYDLIPDKIYVAKQPKTPYSRTYYIFKDEVFPIHSNLKIQIKNWFVPKNLEDKIVLVGENIRKRKRVYLPTIKENILESSISEPAEIYIDLDTTSPKIALLNYNAQKQSFSKNKIQIKITDDLSGIKSYRGQIDGEWILLEYDAKNDLLTHHFGPNLGGSHTLSIQVIDRVNNIAEKEVRFIKP